MTTSAALSPVEEWQTLAAGVAEVQRNVQAIAGRMDTQSQQYRASATAWLQHATTRLHQLRAAGGMPQQVHARPIPSSPMTPAQAMKAQKRLARRERRAAKNTKRLEAMARTALGSMPGDSAAAKAAKVLLDGGGNKAVRDGALQQLIDAVPFDSPIAPMAKMLAKEMLFDDDEEDDD